MVAKRKPRIQLDRGAHKVRCRSIALDAVTVPDATIGAAPVPAVWVQVTEAGDFNGYYGGRFKFDKATFDTIISNFHAHPSYEAGADGVGVADVVPWDFHHASEAPAADVGGAGAPAQGWIIELETRKSAEGVDQLWALTRWLEPARSYIKAGKYKWASVVVDFGARDPKSGNKVGATLISVAITNNPFVEGMTPLVAASKTAPRVAAAHVGSMWVEPACSAEDALDKLRNVLGMPATRAVGEVIAEIMRLQEWVLNGGEPLGVNLDEMLGAIRVILNLPALASNDEVFAEVSKLLQRLLDSVNVGVPAGGADPYAPPPPNPAEVPAAFARKTNTMLLKTLASKLLVQENDAAVQQAVDELLQFRSVLCTITGLAENVSNKKLLEADAGKSVGDARSKLSAILAALGLSEADAGEAINKIASTMESAAKLKEVMPELEALRTEQKKQEEEQVEKDVDEAMASKNLTDAGVRSAFVALRRSDKEAFFKANPKKEGTAATGASTSHLTTQVATTKGGSEQRLQLTDDGKVRVLKPTLTKQGGDERIKLTGLPGRNPVEKTMEWLRKNGHEKSSRDEVWAAACELVRSGKVDIESAA